jgi:hypothetical protein
MSNESNQLNLTVVALVALVAIVGLVALVMNAATISKGSGFASAENLAGDLKRTKPIETLEMNIPEKKQVNPGLQLEQNSAGDVKRAQQCADCQ